MTLQRTLTLSEAAEEIRGTCDRHSRPFFFMVGAGISSPPVPLASAIVEDCRKQRSGLVPPDRQSPMAAYMWWLARAYPSPADRQRYLQSLIEEKPITDANLRLAHLLLSGKFAKLVVTTNFDDFISKALTLFGETHIVCDHPQTVLRIDPEREGLQIVHVHGSYWFYDCCNLAGEIEERAVNSRDEPSSMRDFLDRLLLSRSPIVVGYSGWEGDVFMSALERRLRRELEINLYWFCYRAANIDVLPRFLKNHSDVRFVIPDESPKALEVSSSGGREPLLAMRITPESESQREPVLPAAKVFDQLIRQFTLEAPLLTRDPLGHLAEHLRRSLPRAEEGTAGQDLYRIGQVIETVEGAKAALKRAVLEPLRDALRRSQYGEAVREAEKIGLRDIDSDQVREVMMAMTDAACGLFDNSPEELAAYELTLAAGARLLEQGGSDAKSRAKLAWALLCKGITLGQLNRSEEEIAVYDEVARRFGEATEPALREPVAGALVNKGVRLGELNRSEEAIAVYDEVARRFGEATEPALREPVAWALVNKGVRLGQLNRSEEEIAVYDEVARRFGEAMEPALREQVAR
ncbi:MAG: SIR2 family protein, partial [Bryobacterales bacterium]|nr:SIR2 family protein [Bryobacterales bacterium]